MRATVFLVHSYGRTMYHGTCMRTYDIVPPLGPAQCSHERAMPSPNSAKGYAQLSGHQRHAASFSTERRSTYRQSRPRCPTYE
jgi:hypothetical protein